MKIVGRVPALATLLCLAGFPAAADEGGYVYCDNGLRCFTTPCASNSALDLATGRVFKGVSIDVDGLPADDRNAPDLADALYAGRIVVRATIEMRHKTFHGKDYVLPYLVADRIERRSRRSERRHCSSR